VKPDRTDRLEHVARLAWRTRPHAFARDGRQLSGPVGFGLRSPSGAALHFIPDTEPATIIEGVGAELFLVAARRVAAEDTSLGGTGLDVDAVLELVRTHASRRRTGLFASPTRRSSRRVGFSVFGGGQGEAPDLGRREKGASR
jgi:hypothetical protein